MACDQQRWFTLIYDKWSFPVVNKNNIQLRSSSCRWSLLQTAWTTASAPDAPISLPDSLNTCITHDTDKLHIIYNLTILHPLQVSGPWHFTRQKKEARHSQEKLTYYTQANANYFDVTVLPEKEYFHKRWTVSNAVSCRYNFSLALSCGCLLYFNSTIFHS